MYFDNLNNLTPNMISHFTDGIKKCLTYAKKNDLSSFDCGHYEIDGDNVYLNIAEFETAPVETKGWEAHRKFLDIHLILRGAEQIDVNFTLNMKPLDYLEANDFATFFGTLNGTVILKENDFLICYPTDAHRPGIAPENPEMIKKAVFKIAI